VEDVGFNAAAGAMLGIVSMGRIGQTMAKLAAGFDMCVIYFFACEFNGRNSQVIWGGGVWQDEGNGRSH
jgi:hypothetical protein